MARMTKREYFVTESSDPGVKHFKAGPNCNPYDWYDPAMEPLPGCPMAADWHTKDGAKITAMTADAVLAPFTASPESAARLLAQVKDAYETDAFVMAQIAAVTERVTRPGASKAERRLWTAALIKRALDAKAGYVKTFCLDRLSLCADVSDVPSLMAVAKTGDKDLRAYAEAIIRQVRMFS